MRVRFLVNEKNFKKEFKWENFAVQQQTEYGNTLILSLSPVLVLPTEVAQLFKLYSYYIFCKY